MVGAFLIMGRIKTAYNISIGVNVVCHQNIMLKGIIFISVVIFTFSCQETHQVTMPFRNYGISAERLMPLSYSEAKESFRIWVSRSTSIDTVYAFTMYEDSSFSVYSIKIGQKYGNRKKVIDVYSRTEIKFENGLNYFLASLDSLDLFSQVDQQNMQFVEHQPLSLYIIEYLKDKKYVKFCFQANSPTTTESYKRVEYFMKNQFHIDSSSQ